MLFGGGVDPNGRNSCSNRMANWHQKWHQKVRNNSPELDRIFSIFRGKTSILKTASEVGLGRLPPCPLFPEKSLFSEVTSPERRRPDVGKRGNCQRNCQQMRQERVARPLSFTICSQPTDYPLGPLGFYLAQYLAQRRTVISSWTAESAIRSSVAEYLPRPGYCW